MLEAMELGPEAIEYIRTRLSAGHSLASRLLDLPLDEGRVVTYMPHDVAPQLLTRFDAGGVSARRQTDRAIATFISSYLGGPGARYAVFEDALAHPTDPFLLAAKANVFSYGSEVYEYLAKGDRAEEDITRTIHLAASLGVLGILSAPSSPLDLDNGANSTAAAIDALARSTQHILVDAYDGEGMLVWSKP